LNHSFSPSALFQYAFEINNQKLSNAFIVIIDLFGSEMHFSAGSKIGGRKMSVLLPSIRF